MSDQSEAVAVKEAPRVKPSNLRPAYHFLLQLQEWKYIKETGPKNTLSPRIHLTITKISYLFACSRQAFKSHCLFLLGLGELSIRSEQFGYYHSSRSRGSRSCGPYQSSRLHVWNDILCSVVFWRIHNTNSCCNIGQRLMLPGVRHQSLSARVEGLTFATRPAEKLTLSEEVCTRS